MSAPLLSFDVHAAGAIGGEAIGAFLTTSEAPNHRAAKQLAARVAQVPVVVVPHRKPNEKLERALSRLEPRAPRAEPDRAHRRAAVRPIPRSE